MQAQDFRLDLGAPHGRHGFSCKLLDTLTKNFPVDMQVLLTSTTHTNNSTKSFGSTFPQNARLLIHHECPNRKPGVADSTQYVNRDAGETEHNRGANDACNDGDRETATDKMYVTNVVRIAGVPAGRPISDSIVNLLDKLSLLWPSLKSHLKRTHFIFISSSSMCSSPSRRSATCDLE